MRQGIVVSISMLLGMLAAPLVGSAADAQDVARDVEVDQALMEEFLPATAGEESLGLVVANFPTFKQSLDPLLDTHAGLLGSVAVSSPSIITASIPPPVPDVVSPPPPPLGGGPGGGGPGGRGHGGGGPPPGHGPGGH